MVYEDAEVIAFDKPAGLLTAPDRWDKSRENLMGKVHAVLGREVANVHRLDAATSGLLLCAKGKAVLVALSGQWEGRAVDKRYGALVAGLVGADAFSVDLPLAEDWKVPGRMRVSHSTGKKAETVVRVLERFAGYTWVECEPRTGRTHQIRVHLAERGHPIVGDPFYGDPAPLELSRIKRGYKRKAGEEERPLLARLALHAWRLRLTHPGTGEPLELEAPLPGEIEVALKLLRRYAAPVGSGG